MLYGWLSQTGGVLFRWAAISSLSSCLWNGLLLAGRLGRTGCLGYLVEVRLLVTYKYGTSLRTPHPRI